MKAKVLFAVALIAIALVAVACAPAATPVPAFTPPADAIGTVKIGPSDPIHIAYMMVTSGADGSLGIDSRRGVEIAIDDKGGKLLDRSLKLDGQDSGCGAEPGQAAAAKLAADATILAVVGSSCSSEIRAGGPALSKAGFSVVSPSNTAPDLTDPAKRFAGYFRTAHNDKVQGAVAAQFALKQLKLKTAATIHDGSPYAQGLAGVFVDEFKKGGGTITAQEAVGPDDKDFKPVLTKIAAGKPEIIFYPIFIAAGSLITTQAKTIPGLEEVELMAADGTFSPDMYKAAGKSAIGMYQSSPDFSAFAGGYPDVLAKHQKKYNEKPLSAFHAHAYAAAMIIFAAIEKSRGEGSRWFVVHRSPSIARRDPKDEWVQGRNRHDHLRCERRLRRSQDRGVQSDRRQCEQTPDTRQAVLETVIACHCEE
ncbi:MAG: branched-chain amino acid ABC transporter substrate-binding protein [Chloroflexi bacterium]|nr:branched-chain amino acid ABC transporter substrate-binding protein [Chloroflexota bacterium]